VFESLIFKYHLNLLKEQTVFPFLIFYETDIFNHQKCFFIVFIMKFINISMYIMLAITNGARLQVKPWS